MKRMQEIERVETTSADVNAARIEELKQLFPEAFTEGKIDFEKLRATLGDEIDDTPERYSFSWAGKRDAIRLLQAPTSASLVPVRDESINFDETNHVFIEGENLEVLKLLYKAYFGRIKLIYIDPPYNTGNDLIYQDDYKDPLQPYLQLTGQVDSGGNLLTSNTETSGRFHSSWINMIYPRLFIARQLLSDDGAIFVSIDGNEVHHLRQVMTEIFGEENLIGTVVRATGTTTGQDGSSFGSSFDYMLCYSKSNAFELKGLPLTAKDKKRFGRVDEKGRYSILQLRKTGNADRREDRPNMYYGVLAPDGSKVYPIGPTGYESRWRVEKATYEKWVREGLIEWVENDEGQLKPYVKYYLEGRTKTPSPLWNDIDGNKKGSLELKELFGFKAFDNPKPTQLLKRIMQLVTEESDLVVDFFAGTCGTAQALLELNREKGLTQRFVMVQLPEPTPEGSNARNHGYSDIAQLGKDRVRKTIKKLSEEKQPKLGLLSQESSEDLGFRVFSLAPSNLKAWHGIAEATPADAVTQMEVFNDTLKEGWNSEDVIWEATIKEGFPLNSRISQANVGGQAVYRVYNADDEQQFHICLDDKVSADVPRMLGLTIEDLFVCRDRALDDTTAANLALACRLKTI